jgi:hypothetical protein
MGVFGFGSCDSDSALDVLQDIQDAYDLCDPESRAVTPNKTTAIQDLRAYDPVFGGDGGEARVAYRLISDGFKLHRSVLDTALEWLRLEDGVLKVAGDSGGGWCTGGAKKRREAIKSECEAIAAALIESHTYHPPAR